MGYVHIHSILVDSCRTRCIESMCIINRIQIIHAQALRSVCAYEWQEYRAKHMRKAQPSVWVCGVSLAVCWLVSFVRLGLAGCRREAIGTKEWFNGLGVCIYTFCYGTVRRACEDNAMFACRERYRCILYNA